MRNEGHFSGKVLCRMHFDVGCVHGLGDCSAVGGSGGIIVDKPNAQSLLLWGGLS